MSIPSAGASVGERLTPAGRAHLVATLDGAVRWLLESGVRTADGGFRSIYRPGTDTWVTYGSGRSCLQCTAGGVLALLAAAGRPSATSPDAATCLRFALESAEHIRRLVHRGPGSDAGMLPCGLGADGVKLQHTEAALRSLIQVHDATGDAAWLEAAAAAGRWAIAGLQSPDGSFRSGTSRSPVGRLRGRLFGTRPSGAAACVATFRRLAKLTGESLFDESAVRLMGWLRRQQDDEGALPMYSYHPLSRLLASRRHGGWAELRRGCLRYHPAPNGWMIEAYLVEGNDAGARRVSAWFHRRLSPNGLLYQYYFTRRASSESLLDGFYAPGGIVETSYGSHSVEEDVMPTASLGLHWLARPDLVPEGDAERMLAWIASGIAYSQVRGGGAKLEGGIRGLPLHPTANDDIYTWDTVYAVLYLATYLDAVSPAGS